MSTPSILESIASKPTHKKAPLLIVAMLVPTLLGFTILSKDTPHEVTSATQRMLYKVDVVDTAQDVTQNTNLTFPALSSATTYEFHYTPKNTSENSSNSTSLLNVEFDLGTFLLNPVYCDLESAYLLYVHNGTISETIAFRGTSNADIPNLHYFQDILTKTLYDYPKLRFQFEFIKTSPRWTPAVACTATGLFSALTIHELWQESALIGPLSILLPLETYVPLVVLGSSLIALESALLYYTPVWELPVDKRSTYIVVPICIGILVLLTGWLTRCRINRGEHRGKQW